MGRLLPCPFCGNVDVDMQFSAFQRIGDDDSKTLYDPGCMKCGASAPKDVWNTRALSLESVREEGLDAKMVDLLIDTTWRKCVGQCIADNCGRFFISRERFDEHIVPLIRALQHASARVAEGEVCPRCNGSGETKGMTYGQGPDDHEIDIPCPDCNGTGESPAKEQPGFQMGDPHPCDMTPTERKKMFDAPEQPGEQNAAPQVSLPARMGREAEADFQQVESATSARANPTAAAPDVVAMVRRLRDRGRELAGSTLITAQDDSHMMFEAAARIEKLGQGWIPDEGCICRGNWRAIVKETEGLIGKKFRDRKGEEYTFYGIVHGDDDYYYGMYKAGDCRLLSCVGSIEGHDFTLIGPPPPERP